MATFRQRVERRAGHKCEYCKSPARYSTQSYALDHVLPKSAGGTRRIENTALACQGCNNFKYNKTRARDPATKMRVPLFHPRLLRWEQHFTWDERFEVMIGVTPTGRATVEALKLNREELVRLRRLLFAAGEHP